MAFESVIDAILNDKPITHIGEHKGWAKLEDYTGTPHLWKALSHYTGNINVDGKISELSLWIQTDKTKPGSPDISGNVQEPYKKPENKSEEIPY